MPDTYATANFIAIKIHAPFRFEALERDDGMTAIIITVGEPPDIETAENEEWLFPEVRVEAFKGIRVFDKPTDKAKDKPLVLDILPFGKVEAVYETLERDNEIWVRVSPEEEPAAWCLLRRNRNEYMSYTGLYADE